MIDRAYEDDAAVARSEWGGLFRDDLETYVSPEIVEECTDPGVLGRAVDRAIRYIAHADPAGGSGSDSFTLAIGHVDNAVGILDCLIEFRPPFNPENAVGEICDILVTYGLYEVTGDKYAAGFNSEVFRRHGVDYRAPLPPMTTSDYFGGFLPILNSRKCRLLDNKRLALQLCALERRPSRVGAKDAIGHPPGGHDDLCASVAGLMVRLVGKRDYSTIKNWTVPYSAQRERTFAEYPSVPGPHNYENPAAPSRPEYASAGDDDWLKCMAWKPKGGW